MSNCSKFSKEASSIAETDAPKLFQPRFSVLSDVRVLTNGRMLLLNMLPSRFSIIKFFHDLKSWTFGGSLKSLELTSNVSRCSRAFNSSTGKDPLKLLELRFRLLNDVISPKDSRILFWKLFQ
uniref:Uncharacterized protein n=1 Tax=Rhizophora mucronata TaxID=61149 RepID=A0A2P2MW55_RHIMU